MTPCPQWTDEVPGELEIQFDAALKRTYRQVESSAKALVVNEAAVCGWHRRLFEGIPPVDYYAGNFRQVHATNTCLQQDVEVGGVSGTHFPFVLQELADLFSQLRVSILRAELYWKDIDQPARAIRLSVLLAALVGEFIRIHPFLNGNGRLSRLLWAWGLMRFGVPLQHRIHPRPAMPYGTIMRRSMLGDHGPLAAHILNYLAKRLKHNRQIRRDHRASSRLC